MDLKHIVKEDDVLKNYVFQLQTDINNIYGYHKYSLTSHKSLCNSNVCYYLTFLPSSKSTEYLLISLPDNSINCVISFLIGVLYGN